MPVVHADLIAVGRGPRGAPGRRSTRETRPSLWWLFVAAVPVWLGLAAVSVWSDGARVPVALPDSDDAMRLVQVRDLLAGQPWYDLMQYRLGAEPGPLMQWSRLVDAPIAVLILG